MNWLLELNPPQLSSAKQANWYREQKMQKVRVLSQEEIAPGVFMTGFEKPFKFTAGQVVMLTTEASIPGRMYSLASGEGDSVMQILYDLKSEGVLTPRLSALQAGDSLMVSEPFGSFINQDGPSCWIATGTGIAPFLSMVLSGQHPGKVLIHGSRDKSGFYLQDLLTSTMGACYIRCCSGGEEGDFYKGRVTRYLQEHIPLITDGFHYLCGSAEMVVDVRQVLLNGGIPYNRIMAEIYF